MLLHSRIYASGAFSESDKQLYKNLIETSAEPYFQNLRSKGDYETRFELNDYSYLVLYDKNLDPSAYLELPPVKQNKTVYVKMEKLEDSIKSDFDKYISDHMQKAVNLDPSLFRIEVRKEETMPRINLGDVSR